MSTLVIEENVVESQQSHKKTTKPNYISEFPFEWTDDSKLNIFHAYYHVFPSSPCVSLWHKSTWAWTSQTDKHKCLQTNLCARQTLPSPWQTIPSSFSVELADGQSIPPRYVQFLFTRLFQGIMSKWTAQTTTNQVVLVIEPRVMKSLQSTQFSREAVISFALSTHDSTVSRSDHIMIERQQPDMGWMTLRVD